MVSRLSLLPAAFTALAALSAPSKAVADAGDSFCGPGLQYLVALRCGGSGPVVLQCVPDALRGEICTLPNTVFAQELCRKEAGETVEPTLVEAATGTSSRQQAPCPLLPGQPTCSALSTPPMNSNRLPTMP